MPKDKIEMFTVESGYTPFDEKEIVELCNRVNNWIAKKQKDTKTEVVGVSTATLHEVFTVTVHYRC